MNLESEMQSSSADKCIFSYEGLASLDKVGVDNLQKFLARWTDCPRILMYCRDPVQYAESSYSQLAKMGFPHGPNLLTQLRVPYQHYLTNFLGSFKKKEIYVRLFQPSLPKGPNIISDFFPFRRRDGF